MGFDISHQHVGLNRVGVFFQTARTKGPDGQKAEGGKQKAETEKLNEPWRRISDLVGKNAQTRDLKVRKRCVKKLVAWIDRRVSADRARIENGELKMPQLTEAWGEDASKWRRASHGGLSVEAICFQLGMSRARLTALTKEALNVSAGELIDGFKIRGLRKYLIGQLRDAASRVWGCPGDFAVRRCDFGALSHCGESETGNAGRVRADRMSAVHGTAGGTPAPHRTAGAVHATAWDEERLRVNQLLGALEELREENDFRLGAFAARLGFETSAKFRAACLTVMGRTMEQLERILAHEIVSYYLAAEDLALRKLAGREDVLGFRAREIYWGCEDAPIEPFLDRWSAYEAGRPEWLRKMKEEFG